MTRAGTKGAELVAIAMALLFGAACGSACDRRASPRTFDAGETPAGPEDGACRLYVAEPQQVGSVPDELAELSGLAASARYPNLFWAHNDSNNALELFAIRESGEIVARFPLTGVSASDVEAITLGPCVRAQAERCVFLGDIGDNYHVHATRKLLEVPEPDPLAPGPLQPEVISFRYPEGRPNAEGLVSDPRTGALYVITKAEGSLGEVFRIDRDAAADPSSANSAITAVKVGTLKPRGGQDAVSTAADLHPSGARLLIRSYGHVWEFRREGATSVEELTTVEGVELPAGAHVQPEAITYLGDGRGYLMGSEGSGAPLFKVDCRP